MANDNNYGFGCGCCLGLAIGYAIWGGNDDDNKKCETPELGSSSQQLSVQEPENILIRQIVRYQKEIAPRLKEHAGGERLCKYEPSCSAYARQSIEQHGSLTGIVMASARLARCNPLSKGGDDPVGTPWYAKRIL